MVRDRSCNMSDAFSYISEPVGRRLIIAMSELMNEKEMDDITTSEILARSGISRSTFYRRYRDKYDLLTHNYEQLMNQTVMQIGKGMSYRTAFRSLYSTISKDPDFFGRALRSTAPNGLRNFITERSLGLFEELLTKYGLDLEDPYYHMLYHGYVYGAIEVTCIWAQEGMKIPVDKLLHICYELMPHEMQTCMALEYM